MKSLIPVFILCLFVISYSQVIKSTAEISYNHLPLEEHQYIDDLDIQIQDYINNYAWTEDEYETDIDVTIYIIIETVQQKSFEKIYKSQFQIKSVSGESFYDKNWEFPYQIGYPMDHNKMQFDPLCHFLDFYIYLVLGGELDTYGLLLGTAYYDKAQDLANRGILSQYSRGWADRLEELQKITNTRTRPLREAKPDFFEAVFLLQEGRTKEARTYALKVIDAIEQVVKEQPNNKYLKMFFDAHNVTLAELFKNDADILSRLVDYDSIHREVYRDAMP
jgi:hypothetical protein